MTRHQRRKLAKKRLAAKLALGISRELHIRKLAKERDNLSSPVRGKRTPTGLVSSIYSGAANPLGYTRPLRYTKGACK